MVWFKVDDKAHANNKIRKVLAEEPAALALWTVAGSWSADALTDGYIPDHQISWLLPTRGDELAQVLVNARLWRRVRGGYKFHEWEADADGTKRNPTKSEVEASRLMKAEAGRKGGVASGLSRGKPRSKHEARASADASAGAKAGAEGLVEPPTRPSALTEQRGEGLAPAHARGGALPPPDNPTDGPSFFDDPVALAEYHREIRELAEERTRLLAADKKRAHDGAAMVRAALRRDDSSGRPSAAVERLNGSGRDDGMPVSATGPSGPTMYQGLSQGDCGD